MSSTAASANFRSIFDAALDNYIKQTGIDLTRHPSAHNLQDCHSTEDILQLLLERETAFKEYRDKYRELIDSLRPVVQVVHAFSGTLSKTANLVPFPPTKAIFTGIDILLSAVIGITTSYDALIQLFESVANFLRRLHIYTQVPLSPTTFDVLVRIMGEILSVLALATKQINQGRFKKFTKTLLGERDVEAILRRLDRLTQEEARMTVAHTLEVVHGLFSNLRVVMDDGKASGDVVWQALGLIQETTNKVNKIERDRLQEKVRLWLSPPDPSINHNIARRDHHSGTASWFTESSMLEDWKSTGSLLWIYGKPGAGKSILCSSIIQEVKGLRDRGLALLAYFYCDFRDPRKQERGDLLASLIAQLSAKSDPCYDILSSLHSDYNAGSERPGDDALMDCLEQMLNIEGQPPIYIIIDALDESPNDSGVKSTRERVLELVTKLVDLHLPNVCLCATSRPEADIQAALVSLATHTVSLHDEGGQKKDIANYVRSIVYSDWKMRRWREDDKEVVIDMLSRRADGMFRWVVCQLEALKRSLPSTIRRVLNDLPTSLDETYDRILLGISRERQGYARRLFQCLAASIRPLRVEELADILAIQFDTGKLPDYEVTWRPENAEEELLSVCSSLITIVDVEGSRVVQFSHFSVKEYLTSQRLVNSGKHISQYHILSRSAHMTLAQASLSVLLALGDPVDKNSIKSFPLAIYAAQYWVDHARFGDVFSSIKHTSECLFDPTKPHFYIWVWIYDIDNPFRPITFATHPTIPQTGPLYYAVLCGFRDLVEHLIVDWSQDVNARGGGYATPLHAAILRGNIDITKLLLENGADVAAPYYNSMTPLAIASAKSRLDTMELLLNHHADVDSYDERGASPLYIASADGELAVARMLLRHGAAVDSRVDDGSTPLIIASHNGHLNVARSLLENGATVDSQKNDGWTALMAASENGHLDVVQLLLQSGATMELRTNMGETSLNIASRQGHPNIVRLLLQNNAIVDTHNNKTGWAPLMWASQNGHLDIVDLLLQNGAAVDIRNSHGVTPLLIASSSGHPNIVRLLLQNGATVDCRDEEGSTSLILSSRDGHLDVVHALLESGAAVDLRNNMAYTPLMLASGNGHLDVVRLLLQNGATVDSQDNDLGWTPLMWASRYGRLDVIHLLLQNGAAVEPRGNIACTPLMAASENGHSNVVRLLLQNGAAVDSHNNYCRTPLMSASLGGHLEVVDVLLQSGATVDFCHDQGSTLSNSSNSQQSWFLTTSLHFASANGHFNVAKSLIQFGADVNALDQNQKNPLDLASNHGHLDTVHLLLDSGSNVNSQDHEDSTPLHQAAGNGHLDIVILLLNSGADIDIQNSSDKTPLDLAHDNERLDVARFLAKYKEGTDFQDDIDSVPSATASRDPLPNVARPSLGDEENGNNLKGKSISLHLASLEGDVEMVQSLLDDGADVNEPDMDYRTPMIYASRWEVMKLLIEYGADVNFQDGNGWSPLILAVRSEHTDIVHLLLDHGADVNAKDRDSSTALHSASDRGLLEIVKALLERGANVHVRDDDARTPSQIASRRGKREIAQLLSEAEYGAQPGDGT